MKRRLHQQARKATYSHTAFASPRIFFAHHLLQTHRAHLCTQNYFAMNGYEKFDNVEGVGTPSAEQVQLSSIVSADLEVGMKAVSLFGTMDAIFRRKSKNSVVICVCYGCCALVK